MSNIAQTIDFVTPSTVAVALSQTINDGPSPSANTHRSNGASPNNLADNAARMAELFASSDRGHGTHGEPTQHPGSLKCEIKGTARTVREPPTIALWEKHLKGERPLGVIPIREDGKCKWGSIDVDQYEENFLELINTASRAKLPLVACRSKSGGLHLYLFLIEWTPAELVVRALKRVARSLRLTKSEIFPKQTQLAAGNGDLGNWILAPYLGSTYGGKLKEQCGITQTGGEMSLGAFLNVAEDKRVSPAQLDELSGENKNDDDSESDNDAEDGAVVAAQYLAQCLERLAAAEIGKRNITLNKVAFLMGRYVGAGWIDENEVREKLLEAALRSGLDHQEIQVTLRSGIEAGKKQPATLADAHPALIEMNENFAVVQIGGKTRVLSFSDSPVGTRGRVPVYQTLADFREFQNKYRVEIIGRNNNTRLVPRGKWWLDHPHRRQYSGVAYAPNMTLTDRINLWTGWGCEPRAGDCQLYLDHLRDNICSTDATHYNYLLNWMAYAVQRPEKQGEVAVVMRGKEGVGKGIFARQFGQLFGAHFLHVTQAKHLTGHFNAHLQQCSVLFVDEAFFAGDRAHAPILKALITEPTMMIEPKGVDPYAAPNYIHLIMASNNEWVVPADADARRYFVLDVSDAKKQDTEYFERLVDQMNSGGREALLDLLLKRDLSGFNVRKVPQTAALGRQKDFTRRGLDRLIETIAQGGELPWALYNHANVAKTSGEGEGRGFYVAARKIVRDLEHVSSSKIAKMLQSEWGTTSWNSNGVRGIEFPKLAELRKRFDAKHGPQEWDKNVTAWEYSDRWDDVYSTNSNTDEMDEPEIPF
jgi:hypothetical protein